MLSPHSEVFRNLCRVVLVTSVVMMGGCLTPFINILIEFGSGKCILMANQLELFPCGVLRCNCIDISSGGIAAKVMLYSLKNLIIEIKRPNLRLAGLPLGKSHSFQPLIVEV